MVENRKRSDGFQGKKERTGQENLPADPVLRTKNKPNPCNPPWFVVN